MFLFCYEIGCNLFLAILILAIFVFIVLIAYIILKHCTDCKKMCQECLNRELMYSKTKDNEFDGNYEVEISKNKSVRKFDILIKKKEDNNNEK